VDETYIGGKVRGRGRGYRDNKTMVVGAIERGGKLRVKTAPGNSRDVLHGFIGEVVSDDAEAIYTDEWLAYRGAADRPRQALAGQLVALLWVSYATSL